MVNINRFPAILLAGPPHAGKSVLAYHLTNFLKNKETAFILLRATPDGEGDWFLEAHRQVAMLLRTQAKGEFTPKLVQRAVRAVRYRQLPMLVDVGGRPRDEQWEIPKGCTHYILLYREEADRRFWQEPLDTMGLLPIARFRSELHGEDKVQEHAGVLEGVISGLDRRKVRLDRAFEALAQRVHGLFDYTQEEMEAIHLAQAPSGVPIVIVRELAQQIGVRRDPQKGWWWEPEDLARVPAALPGRESVGLYGRGPVWLTAAIAGMVSDFWLFDARHFGWMQPPPVYFASQQSSEEVTFLCQQEDEGRVRLRIQLHEPFIVPAPLHLPPLPEGRGIILDGKAPAWLYAALVRALRPFFAEQYVFEPRGGPQQGRCLPVFVRGGGS